MGFPQRQYSQTQGSRGAPGLWGCQGMGSLPQVCKTGMVVMAMHGGTAQLSVAWHSQCGRDTRLCPGGSCTASPNRGKPAPQCPCAPQTLASTPHSINGETGAQSPALPSPTGLPAKVPMAPGASALLGGSAAPRGAQREALHPRGARRQGEDPLAGDPHSDVPQRG